MSLSMSQEDPWSWGVEDNSDGQLSTNTTTQQDIHTNERLFERKATPREGGPPPPGANFNFGVNNNNIKVEVVSGGPKHGVIGQRPTSAAPPPSAHPPPSQQYFTNRTNNNSIPDVENKEIVPPDFNHFVVNQGSGRVSEHLSGNTDVFKGGESNHHNSMAPPPFHTDWNNPPLSEHRFNTQEHNRINPPPTEHRFNTQEHGRNNPPLIEHRFNSREQSRSNLPPTEHRFNTQEQSRGNLPPTEHRFNTREQGKSNNKERREAHQGLRPREEFPVGFETAPHDLSQGGDPNRKEEVPVIQNFHTSFFNRPFNDFHPPPVGRPQGKETSLLDRPVDLSHRQFSSDTKNPLHFQQPPLTDSSPFRLGDSCESQSLPYMNRSSIEGERQPTSLPHQDFPPSGRELSNMQNQFHNPGDFPGPQLAFPFQESNQNLATSRGCEGLAVTRPDSSDLHSRQSDQQIQHPVSDNFVNRPVDCKESPITVDHSRFPNEVPGDSKRLRSDSPLFKTQPHTQISQYPLEATDIGQNSLGLRQSNIQGLQPDLQEGNRQGGSDEPSRPSPALQQSTRIVNPDHDYPDRRNGDPRRHGEVGFPKSMVELGASEVTPPPDLRSPPTPSLRTGGSVSPRMVDVMSSRGRAAGQDHPDNQETLTDSMGASSNQASLGDDNNSCPSDRNLYLESSHLSSQMRDLRLSPDKDTPVSKEGSNEREVPGEADQPRRVVLGQGGGGTSSQINTSRSQEERMSLERLVVGERREGGDHQAEDPPRQRQPRHNRHPHRESSYEEDEHDYPSDRDRRAYRREDRHRRRRDHGSSEYMSDDDYEYERRPTYRRERRVREPRDYSPEYRREYYRDEPRRGRREYYNRDYEDEGYYKERSRPSSRSGSDYRRTNVDYQQRGSRQNYYQHSNHGGYSGMREYEYNQEYYEMLRRNHPAYYAMWYQEYVSKMAANQSYTNDRASVHSGQSTNNRVTTPNAGLDTNVNSETFDDYSPRLFSTAHTRGNFDNQGRLVVVDAHYPMDGQMASVQLCSVEPQTLEPNVKEFLETPGPFIPGVTHRSTVLQYLRKMSEHARDSSEKLLYDLVHLTVKSNGNPNASDISELLVESYNESKEGSREGWDQTEPAQISHGQMVARFRELLLQGNKTEALEWAMEHGGWGHALFLASKMDRRTHNNVMLQFANSLPANDPLQTLYQLMSNHVPQAATSCGDEKWSDWRPHLAMILSNSTDNPDMDRKAIITLGDTLGSRGKTYAAHLCYLIAQVGFCDYSLDAKLVLLGTSSNQPFEKFFNYRSILLTLCYEYGIKQGMPHFSIPTLQSYKVLLASRLVDWGRSRSALQYCELTASEILSNGQTTANVVNLLIELSTKLKMLDPQLALSRDTSLDPDWLAKLKQFSVNLPDDPDVPDLAHQPSLQVEGDNNGDLYNGGNINDQVSRVEERHDVVGPEGGFLQVGGGAVTGNQDLTRTSMHHHPAPLLPVAQQHDTSVDQQSQSVFHPPSYSTPTHQQINGYQQAEHQPTETHQWAPQGGDPVLGQIENKPSLSFYHTSEQQLQGGPGEGGGEGGVGGGVAGGPVSSTGKPLVVESKKKGAEGGKGSSWFGGFWDKLTPKPKNQMVLPDDTDPKIVFDPKLKRWVDREGDESERGAPMKPPPMVAPLPAGGAPIASAPAAPAPSNQPPFSNNTNKYKLQKGKSMKSNYVDVLGGGRGGGVGAKSQGSGMQPMVPSIPHQPVAHNFFIPPPVESHDSPLSSHDTGKTQDMNPQSLGAPVMYNPANFT